MTAPVYADATVLIGLARIDRLDLLALLSNHVRVMAVVWDEVARDAAKPGVAALHRAYDDGLLVVVAEGDPAAYPELDPGEVTVLSTAAVARAAVLIDERKGRVLIRTDAHLQAAIPRVTRIIGLLLLAKQRGRITAIRPLLDELIGQSFWISPAFYDEILRQADEA